MRKYTAVLLAACLMAGVWGPTAIAQPVLDGENIESDFGTSGLLAVQTNRTGFGKSELRFTASGNEMDQLWVGQDGTYLYIGITGNLETNGNEFHIYLDTTTDGQNPLQTELCGGPPYALQDLGAEAHVNTNGTPGDTTDDYWERTGAYTGAVLDAGFKPNFAITANVYQASMYASIYKLMGTPNPYVSPYDHPDTVVTETLDVYTTRCYLGRSTVNVGPATLSDGGQGWPDNECATNGYDLTTNGWQMFFDDTNTAGVDGTGTSGQETNAATATKGLEIRAPLADLGLTPASEFRIMAFLTASGGGYTSNHTLPPTNTYNNWNGRYPQIDFTASPDYDGAQYATVNLAAMTMSPPPVLDGQLTDAAYATTLVATQAWGTQYGDQVTAGGVEVYPRSELDALYVTNGPESLIVGMTGSLETNGNRLLLFLDTKDGGQDILDLGTSGTSGALTGLEDDGLPLLVDNSLVYYDYVIEANASGGWLYVDHHELGYPDIVHNRYIGDGPCNTEASPLANGDNPAGMALAYDYDNADTATDGVPACGDFDSACFFDPPATIAAAAMTKETGFEIRLPYEDIGIEPGVTPNDIHLWAFITSGGGYGSDQGLPTLRSSIPPASDDDMEINVGQWKGTSGLPADYTRPGYPDPNANYNARAAEYSLVSMDLEMAVMESCRDHGSPAVEACIEMGAGDGAKAHGDNVEPRLGGIDTLLITLNDVAPAATTATVSCMPTAYTGTIVTSSRLPAYNQVTVEFSPAIPDVECCEITLDGVAGNWYVATLAGDANRDGDVNSLDYSYPKGRLGFTGEAAPQADVNVDNDVTSLDYSAIKLRLGHVISCPMPVE